MRTGGARPTDAAEVTTSLFRALAVARALLVGYVVTLNLVRLDEFDHPGWALTLVAVVVLWSGLVTWLYDAPARRRLPVYLADLAVAVALLAATPLVQSQEMLDRYAATVPSFWVAAPVLAVSAGRGWLPALGAAGVVSATDLALRQDRTGTVWGNIIILVLLALVVGYAAEVLRQAVEARARAERAAADYEARTRLARVVHDGVLQVLALVQRQGDGELARLAAEQEVALRALIQRQARPAAAYAETDLLDLLEPLASPQVTVTGPAQPVTLPEEIAHELAAAVGACLDNVRLHVGLDARAWVFVDDLGEEVEVSVRDEGPGIAPGRLEEAARDGRLGVASSICGRLEDLGGTATLRTAPGQGVEWELRVPR